VRVERRIQGEGNGAEGGACEEGRVIDRRGIAWVEFNINGIGYGALNAFVQDVKKLLIP
jgi:hypothetical protein